MMEQTMEYAREARVKLDQPLRYMVQLCKHFEHRLQVAYEGDRGSIIFPNGTCFLHAEPETLMMRAQSATAEGLVQLQDVVARHLLRFAFRSPPEIVWKAMPEALPLGAIGVGETS